MRIGIDARLWNETGVGRYIRNLVRELSVIDKTNDYVLFVGSRDAERIKKQELRIKENWKIVEADIRWHTIDEQLKFPKILEKENLDLMHFPYFSIPIFYKGPYIVTIHDLILNHFPTGKASTLPFPLYQLKRIGYDFVLNTASKNAKKIIVPLNAVKDDVIKTLHVPQEKIEVTYEGVDQNLKFKIQNTKLQFKDKKYFLYVGNAYPHKNLDRLIDAFNILYRDMLDINLILVGKDDFFYKRLNEEFKNEKTEGISILNNVNDLELAGLYKNAIALIAPSHMEGFGLPVVEAMASGCLVIASNIPSFSEVAKDCIVYFDQNSEKDTLRKMKSVLEMSKKEKEIFVKKGLERAKFFSWRKMAEETLKIYESCFSL